MYKKTILIFFISFASFIIAVFLPLYINDPLQLFHKSFKEKVTFTSNMRVQAASLINNYAYDSIILGTSMLANTSAKEANEFLGGKFINISILGGDFHERSILLKYALKKQNVKKVIYSFDDIYLNPTYQSTLNFEYLYDDNIINDFKVYLNKKYIFKCLLGFSSKETCVGKQKDLSRISAWYKEPIYARHFGGLDKMINNHTNELSKKTYANIAFKAKELSLGKTKPIKSLDKKEKIAFKYIDKNIIETVKNNPNTEFILIFPPYSRLVFSIWAQYDLSSFEVHKSVLKYISKQSEVYKNLKVYAFEDRDFLDDIKNYKDPTHYNHFINTWILKSIKKEDGKLTSLNVQEYINTITLKDKNYNLIKLGLEIEKRLNTNMVKYKNKETVQY